MSAHLQRMIQPLRELAQAARHRDVPGVYRTIARVLEPAGYLYSAPAPISRDGRPRPEAARGEVLLLVELARRELDAMPLAAGAAGIVWDQGWAVASLDYLMVMLKGFPRVDTPDPEPEVVLPGTV